MAMHIARISTSTAGGVRNDRACADCASANVSATATHVVRMGDMWTGTPTYVCTPHADTYAANAHLFA